MYGDSNGNRTRPFLAPPNLILQYLTFAEFLNGHSLKFRVMKEQIVPVTLDKPKTSFRNQPLDFTLWHFCSPM